MSLKESSIINSVMEKNSTAQFKRKVESKIVKIAILTRNGKYKINLNCKNRS